MTRLIASLLLFWLNASCHADTPDVVNLCDQQSPIRSQAGRDACTYFPPIAALEAAYRRQGMNVDLSVEHLIWIRNVTASKSSTTSSSINENNLAFLTGGGLSVNFELLTKYGVCKADEMPYQNDHENYKAKHYVGFDVTDYKWFEPHRQRSLNAFNLDPRNYPQNARRQARYGIDEYVFLKGADCRNIQKIEEILASGHEVAVNMMIKYKRDSKDESRGNIPSIVWYHSKNAIVEPGNSHAMLLVGYDRTRQFFIVKNSWGANRKGYDADALPEGWKDIVKYKGFTLIHYNYLSGNREAAYIKKVTDPTSRKYPLQPLLGMWEYTIKLKKTDEPVSKGVLAWRKLPDADGKHKRIGDLYTSDRKEFRVNAEVVSNEPHKIVLHFDPDQPNLPASRLQGFRVSAVLNIPETGPCIISEGELKPPEGKAELFGLPVSELKISAVQIEEGNPLQEWHQNGSTPKEKND